MINRSEGTKNPLRFFVCAVSNSQSQEEDIIGTMLTLILLQGIIWMIHNGMRYPV